MKFYIHVLEGDGARLDMNGKFQDAAGKILPDLYSPDQVHLAKGGYEVWEELMQPILAEMLK